MVRLLPFQSTVDPEMKLVPVTVNVNAAPPAGADDGEIAVTVGTGLFGGGELPPPPQATRNTAQNTPSECPRRILGSRVLGTIWVVILDWTACLGRIRPILRVMSKAMPFSFAFLAPFGQSTRHCNVCHGHPQVPLLVLRVLNAPTRVRPNYLAMFRFSR